MKILARDANAADLLGAIAAAQVQARTADIVGGYVGEDAVLCVPSVVDGYRCDSAGSSRRPEHELDHAAGFGIGKRLEEHRVHDRKNRGVGSDSEGERR